MAPFNFKFSTFLAFFCFACLISSTNGMVEIDPPPGKIIYCLRASRLWKGGHCIFSDRCSQLCSDKEGAHGGYCMNSVCWCKRKCCPRPSGTWKGLCFSSRICSNQCMKKQNAVDGTCDFLSFNCECLYYC